MIKSIKNCKAQGLAAPYATGMSITICKAKRYCKHLIDFGGLKICTDREKTEAKEKKED
jgi:hypothetical protein